MEVRKETTVPSLGPVGYLEERGASGSLGQVWSQDIQATPEVGNGRAHSTLGPRKAGEEQS